MPKTKPTAIEFRILDEAEVPVADLVPDQENPNVHDEENIAQVMTSLATFGQPARIIVRKSDRVVFDGNGRFEAMQRLAWPKARVQYVEGTDAACRAYSIVAQDTARTSRWDPELLAQHLQDLDAEGMLEATTWTPDRLRDLLEDLEAPDFKDLTGGIPQTGAEDPTAIRCPACGHAFHPGEEGATVKGRKYREERRAQAKADKAAKPKKPKAAKA